MATVQDLAALGEKMGLEKDELKEFIKEQQNLARDEREREREIKDKDREMDFRREQIELEKVKERTRQMEMQVRLGIAGQGTSVNLNEEGGDREAAEVGRTVHQKVKGPKMSPFDERDDMDSYIHRFERYAELQGWHKDDWATYLSALLKGTALDVYARLPPDQAGDYKVLKTALLKRYLLTEDGYRQRFYDSRPEKGETPQQFITRLDNYFLRWLELAKVQQTFDGVRSLIVRERYLATCPKPLELFLKERSIVDLTELARLAEQFESAHGPSKAMAKPEVHAVNTGKPELKVNASHNVLPAQTQSKPKCYNCGRIGHIAKNCFQKARTGAMVPATYWSSRQRQGLFKPNKDHHQHKAGGDVTDKQNEFREVQQGQQRYCRAHGHVDCQECTTVTPPGRHTCNALLGPVLELKCGCTVPVVDDTCGIVGDRRNVMPVTTGMLFGKDVQVLRDTGCSTVVVKRSLVPAERLTGRSVVCMLIDGTARRTPTAMIDIETPYLSGTVEAVCMKEPMYELIIGNVSHVQDKKDYSSEVKRNSDVKAPEVQEVQAEVQEVQAVVTRAQAQRENKTRPLNVSQSIGCDITVEEMIRLQNTDETLRVWWEKAKNDNASDQEQFGTVFEVKNGMLWRKREDQGKLVTQLAVPYELRNKVMKLAHDCIMSGHQGIKKTYQRVTAHFFWPGVHGDVVRYCRSCDICQRTVPKGRIPKVPLGKMPLIDMPFKRVAIDLIGPIAPVTDRGNRYILTMVDYATRYPEAVALKNIDVQTVAEALVTMFTRVGIPQEVLSDQGSQFMSGTMKEVSCLLSMTQLVTSVYHPMCNGLVEKFNGTLKSMLKRMCSERPKDWDRYLPALLFAYREVPQESLGFSPFELLYGRTVRGPMAILKEVWTKEGTEPEVKLTYQYVLELQERLQNTCELARDALTKAQHTQKHYFDRKSKDRTFKPGEKVLLLLPTDNNKLLMQWKGPFEVIERKNDNNYRIQLSGKVKLFHANMLKKYTERSADPKEEAEILGVAIIDSDQDVDMEFVELPKKQNETYKDVKVNPELPPDKRQEVIQLLAEFEDVFTDVPKVTNLGEHSIQLTSSEPIRSKAYPLPFAMREEVDKEIDTMLERRIIEPSTAAYASPIVVVKKPDGSYRICVDYRKINRVTVFDPEPMPQMQEIFADLSGSRYFSKFDFCQGYFQVAMQPKDRDITTFITHRGLFRFRVMPVGLVNAPATFSRIMRKLLDKLQKCRNYLDDVLSHAREWSDHMMSLRQFLTRVREANLALKPSKCFIGYSELTFLGHRISCQGVAPTEDMIAKIRQAPAPTTKKQLRSFLGLVGYYRFFVPNFAAIAVPLTDLTKKGSPNQLQWEAVHEQAFQSLKQYVCNPPVMKLPDVTQPFILQTDASSDGLGCLLLQEVEGVKHPVAFASKKLLPREKNYSTIEREALGIVWAVQKFQNYLLGNHFVLETDHHPLKFLNEAKFQNSRVMRWSLILQPYRFTVRAIKGSQNVGADFLSRHSF